MTDKAEIRLEEQRKKKEEKKKMGVLGWDWKQ